MNFTGGEIMDDILEFLKEKYNGSDVNPLNGGGTNRSFTVYRNGETTLVKVTGISSEDIVNEYNTLQLLSATKISPKVYNLFYIGERACIEMEFIKGKSMLEIILLEKHYQLFIHGI